MNQKNSFTISEMYCCKCGERGLHVVRKNGQYRGPGHLKKMYCVNCQQEWNHAEIRSIHSDYNYEDFLLEMKYNNFDEEGNRKEPYRIFRYHLQQQGLA